MNDDFNMYNIDLIYVNRSWKSWLAHSSHANAYNLQKNIAARINFNLND